MYYTIGTIVFLSDEIMNFPLKIMIGCISYQWLYFAVPKHNGLHFALLVAIRVDAKCNRLHYGAGCILGLYAFVTQQGMRHRTVTAASYAMRRLA